jgi:hypothetical protein
MSEDCLPPGDVTAALAARPVQASFEFPKEIENGVDANPQREPAAND